MNLAPSYARCLAALLFVFTICSSLNAALTPGTKASRYAHLEEVNERWLYEAAPQGLLEEVNYQSESERIADHLLLVATALESRYISTLTKQQLLNRKEALSLLRAYAKTGRFPINAHHDERTPYFVDELGTHCAVGHLMRKTGATAAVEAIRTEINYGYILEELNAYPEIESWGIEHGFTKEELAWIQPGYSALSFTARAFGNNLGVSGGSIYAAVADEDGVYLAGSFTEVDGIPCAGLAYLRNEYVVEVVQPYPIIKALLYDTNNLVLYAHGINPATDEAAVFTVDFARRVINTSLPLSLEDSVQFELTTLGVAIAKQTTGTTPQASLFHHTLGGGVVQLLVDTEWRGTVYDIKTWGDTLAVGGNFVAYQSGIRVDSNCAYLSLAADSLYTDTDAIEVYIGGLEYDTIPGAPIILNFLNTRPNGFYNFLLTTTPTGDSLRAEYFYQAGTFVEGFPFDALPAVPTPWVFPSIITNVASDDEGSFIISGRQNPQPWTSNDTLRSVIYWWESASFNSNNVQCDGRIMALPKQGDSLIVVGNYSALAGQPINDLSWASSEIVSDSREPLKKKDYRCYTYNGEVVVSFTEALPQNATLHLYSIDGRHLRKNTLTAGQTEFRFPMVDQKLSSYVIQTEDGITAGVLVAH